MINTHRPTINLDLDLLRTFVAVADVKTFAAAASGYCGAENTIGRQPADATFGTVGWQGVICSPWT